MKNDRQKMILDIIAQEVVETRSSFFRCFRSGVFPVHRPRFPEISSSCTW